MEFEVIRKSHKKEIIIGVTIFVILAIALVVKFTFAKYELVKSIKIVEGTINYKVPDFKMMAMYKNDGNNYVEIDTMPESGFAINKERSYCTVDNINKVYNKMYTNEDGNHVITGLEKNSKCYIYFDEMCTGKECMLNNVTIKNSPTLFDSVATTDEGLFKTEDNDGDTYYYRGAVENNYVRFAGFYWRIIRINGDGTIRMIYDGTEPHQNGEATSDSIAVTNVRFNENYNDTAYVGFKYKVGELHGLEIKSNALTELEKWYKDNLNSYASKIDTNAGFCGDRTPTTSKTEINNQGGTYTTNTHYGAYVRLVTNKSPVLTCQNTSDLYTINNSNKGNKSLTYPIGLITIDEVAMAGGVASKDNTSYYLYRGNRFLTISPYHFISSFVYPASVFDVYATGLFSNINVYDCSGIRPVVNLRNNIKFLLSGIGQKGSATNPYIVL